MRNMFSLVSRFKSCLVYYCPVWGSPPMNKHEHAVISSVLLLHNFNMCNDVVEGYMCALPHSLLGILHIVQA